ncbi:MAG: DNA internalization-related competence protein ComEC/Rec2 [Ignavibacteriaceae bacterium]|nr:DNA internalization-related competence protein ComEC/Rec2 [Ignavibacteriaceae bacterium]
MKNYPVIKIIPFFISGIILQHFVAIGLLYFAIIYLLALIVYWVYQNHLSVHRILFISLLVNTMFILAGNSAADICFSNRQFYSANIEKENDFTLYGSINSIYLLNKSGLRFEIDVDSAKVNKIILHRKVTLICSVKDENNKKLFSLYSSASPGNRITASGIFIKGRTCRNPGEFDYNNYLHLYGTTGILNVYNTDDFMILDHSVNQFSNLLFRVRKSIAGRLSDYHDFDAASLMKGLLLADRSEMNDETKTEFVNAGVVHVLAVSGLNVEYVLLLCVILLGRFNIYPKSFITICCLILFLLITGIQASVFRAVLMSTLVVMAYISGRSTNVINSLALSAIILLTFSPFYLYDPGFQLSYAAVFSMTLLYPYFHNEIKNIKNKSLKLIAQLVALSLSAQIGTIPFTLFYFGKLSVTSLAANLIVIPFIGFLVGIGLASLLASYFSPFIAASYGSINSVLTKLLYFIVHISGGEKYSFMWIRNYSLYDSIIFYLMLLTLVLLYKKFTGPIAKLLLVAFLLINYITIASFDNKEILTENELNVMMVDVGQGDSFLIRFPDGESALIDAGEATLKFDNGEKVILPLMNHLNIPAIDYAFVSHIDSDHYSGFVSLIQAGRIRRIYKPALDTSLSRDIKFEDFVKRNNIPITHYDQSVIKIGNARIFVLNNISIPLGKNNSNNDRSSLLKIIYGNTSFLFTGDLGKKAEKYYSSYYKSKLKSDVLKVSHHGSKYCSSLNILNNIKPHFALISAGIKNKFHHPAQEVLERLHAFNSDILRTDKLGAVLLRSDGYYVSNVNWRDL